jgi:uncharacterized protein YkuJ
MKKKFEKEGNFLISDNYFNTSSFEFVLQNVGKKKPPTLCRRHLDACLIDT